MQNQSPHLDARRLASLINEEQTGEPGRCEVHLETCDECRQQLERMAAGQEWWSKTQSNLSDFELIDSSVVPGTSSVVATQSDLGSNDSDSSYDIRQILDEPSHPEMLGLLDHYEIERVVGRGGMGIVFKGLDRELNRAVAIKIMSPHLAYNGTARKRFEREARAAAAVVHPNVIPIHGVDSTRQHPYIVMPMVAGRSLQAYVDENGPFDLKDVVRIAMQIASGLEAAHDQGLIHRDIKPANILMEQDISRVMITDFGLARAADDVAMTQTGWLAGTPHYMSPEQARGVAIDCRSDLFSLGSLIYFMSTGREPFRAENPVAVLHKICSEQPLPVRQLNEDLSPELEDIVEKLLEKKPVDRFQSAGELESLLEEYLAYLQHPLSNRPRIKIRTRRQMRRRRRWVQIGLASFVTIALLLAGVFGFVGTDGDGHVVSAAVGSPGAGTQAPRSEGREFASVIVIESDQEPHGISLMSENEFNQQMQQLSAELESLEDLLQHSSFEPTELAPTNKHFEERRSKSEVYNFDFETSDQSDTRDWKEGTNK